MNSLAGAAQQNTIAGSEQDFTHDSVSLRKTLNKTLRISPCLFLWFFLCFCFSHNHENK